ncbi:MAG: hypothetical protein QM786_00425 [Breznakibacter sp.]
MRNKALLLLILFSVKFASCQQYQQQLFDVAKIRNEDFKKYVSAFELDSIPFSTYEEMYCRTRIEPSLIKKFVCSDGSCLKDWSGYEIEFSPCKYLLSNANYIVLIHDESTDGGTIRKLSIYDYNGVKIDMLEIFAEKPFHGKRQKSEIDYFEIESVVNKDFVIERKYFEIYAEEWKINNVRYFHGRYIESVYKINTEGKIILVSEKDHGKREYAGGRLSSNVFFPRWSVVK